MVIAGTCVIGFYRTDFPNAERDSNDVPKRHRIYLILFGLVFLGGGLIGTLGTTHTIADGFQMKYFSNGSLGFCLFYGCYIALILQGVRAFIKRFLRYWVARKKCAKNMKTP